MRVQNCGIVALEKIADINKVSAYSLIQMAKENGVNLLIYQVEPKDLMLVPRPVILHAKDHFVYIKNGEALPKHEYSGFVMSQKGYKGSRIVSYAEAKQVVGAKKAKQILGPILKIVGTVVGTIVGGPLGAVIGASSSLGGTAIQTGGHLSGLDIASSLVGGASGTGFFGGLSAPISAVAGGAKGIAEGNLGQAALGAAGGYLGTKANAGFAEGFNNAASTGSSTLQSLSSGFKNLFNPGSVQGLGGQTQAFNAASGATNALSPYAMPAAAGAGAAMSLATGGIGNAAGAALPNFATGARIIGAKDSPAFSLGNIRNGLSAANVAQGTNGGGILGTGIGDKELLGLAASQIGKPDSSVFDRGVTGVGQDYSALKTYLGDSPLPAATEEELMKYVHTPLDQLTSDLSFGNDAVIRQINQSFDRQIQGVQRQFAQAGQNFTNSSDAQQAIQRINDDRTTQLREATRELQDQNLGRAIQAKQFALSQAFAQNKYDNDLAMDLAKAAGQERELKNAIDTNNYEAFQTIIGHLLYMGYENKQPVKA